MGLIKRLGEYLFTSPHTPDVDKLKVAKAMRSQKAKIYVREHDQKRKASEAMEEQLREASAKCSKASHKEDKRQEAITKYVACDAAMPDELFKLCMYYLAIFVYMARLSFHAVTSVHFLRFLWCLRPNFAKMVSGRRLEYLLANDLLDEAYEETQEIAAKALAQVPGRLTLGIDGHRESKSRHVETITRAKLRISSFVTAEYMLTKRATGTNLATVAFKHLGNDYIALVADNTGSNTGQHTGLFPKVLEKYPTMFCLGCFVHVFDLLIEDIAKLPLVQSIGNDANFCVSFIRKHGLLFEELIICQKTLSVKQELVLFPSTRFAYLYLMMARVLANRAALRRLTELPTWSAVKSSTASRGVDGKKALGEFERFEDLVESRTFKDRLAGGVAVLEPFSVALHYCEGDSVPLSHSFPVFQLLYDFLQQLGDYKNVTNLLPEDEITSELYSLP